MSASAPNQIHITFKGFHHVDREDNAEADATAAMAYRFPSKTGSVCLHEDEKRTPFGGVIYCSFDGSLQKSGAAAGWVVYAGLTGADLQRIASGWVKIHGAKSSQQGSLVPCTSSDFYGNGLT